MTSIEMQKNPLFMRNEFESYGMWNIPTVKKQYIDVEDIELISCADTKRHEIEIRKKYGVHFFVDDYRFKGTYFYPKKTLPKYSQYKFLLTPDFSLYSNMPMWLQISNVAKNRWVGAYWQSKGLTVIPTISWSTATSFKFCFDGIEETSIVAVGMIGSKKNNHSEFMNGYNEMLNRINPSAIICFGEPFQDMEGNILKIPYRTAVK